MKPRVIHITEKNFEYALYSANERVNLNNNDYVDDMRSEYFSKDDVRNASDGLPLYKAIKIIRDIIRNRERCGDYKRTTFYSSKRLESLGYFTDSEKRLALYKFHKDSPFYNKLIFIDDEDKIKSFMLKHLKFFNFDNKEFYNDFKKRLFDEDICFIDTCAKSRIEKAAYPDKNTARTMVSVKFWVARGFSEEYAKEKIKETQRIRSKRCIEHYIFKGCSETEAKIELSKYQSEIYKFNKKSTEYWVRIGFDKESAEKMAYNCRVESSVWATQHWISLGYSEQEAKEKALEYNSSSEKFKLYRKNRALYELKIKRCSDASKFRWSDEEYRKKLKNTLRRGIRSSKVVSKQENKFFEFIINNVDSNIIHKPYIVDIPRGGRKGLNVYFYMCDGYLETEYKNIIIIEYDSSMYHNESVDFLRDGDILDIDDSVIGIIRVTDIFFRSKNISKSDKIKTIDNAIQKIKNSTENRIII